jgi:transcriptional regulator with XRE-family HTH domain/SOS-response transcriptional repressor LexA
MSLPSKNFSQRLKVLMAEHGISTQTVLAEKLRISKNAVTNYVKHGRVPEGDILLKMAEFFGVTTDFLLKGEIEPGPPQVAETEPDNDNQDQKDLGPTAAGPRALEGVRPGGDPMGVVSPELARAELLIGELGAWIRRMVIKEPEEIETIEAAANAMRSKVESGEGLGVAEKLSPTGLRPNGSRIIKEPLDPGPDPFRWAEWRLAPDQHPEDLPPEQLYRAIFVAELRERFAGDVHRMAQVIGIEPHQIYPVALDMSVSPLSEREWQGVAEALGYENLKRFGAAGTELLENPYDIANMRRLNSLRVAWDAVGRGEPPELTIIRADGADDLEVPLYDSGRLAAGDGAEPFDDKRDGWVQLSRKQMKNRAGHKLVALRVGGNSMLPMIPPGAVCIIDTDDTELEPGEIYAIRRQDQLAIKRIEPVAEQTDTWVALSDNVGLNGEAAFLLRGRWSKICVGRVVGVKK